MIASGGMGSPSDLVDAVSIGTADAIAMAHVLHYDVCSLSGSYVPRANPRISQHVSSTKKGPSPA